MLSLYLSLLETDEERDTLSSIYTEHLDWMLQMAYHYLKNEEDAKDAVHEIFYDMSRSGRIAPTGSDDETRAYLFICVRNRVKRTIGKRSKAKIVSLNEAYCVTSEHSVENEVIQKDDKARLISYIDSMPELYKDVLRLYFINDVPLKDIAYALRIPFKTAETRLRRGRELLKERFKDLDV